MAPTKGLSAVVLVEELKQRIISGTVREGEYIPSVRALSEEFGCAPVTVQRALRYLSEAGLVIAEPRQGYRVTSPAAVGKAQEVLVWLEDTSNHEAFLGSIHETQIAVIRRGALARGWALASLPYTGQSISEIGRQLSQMGATALILQDIGERFPRELPAELMTLGLPIVGLDHTSRAPGIDQVMRDEAQGAMLATNYLLERGHRRIGWYGLLGALSNSLHRCSGAVEAMMAAGLFSETMNWRHIADPLDIATAREYLLQPDRPKAVLALWQTAARTLVNAATELGLVLGRDLEVVGWSLEEQFVNSYTPACPELAERCANVTWSMTDVGRLLLNRIEARRREPDLPSARIMLPMKLRIPALK